MVAALTPAALTPGSLEDAVRRQVDRLAEETSIDATYETVGSAWPLPTAIEVVLLRAAQEALTNVRKHAGASKVAVRLEFDDAVRLVVSDDGVGFDHDDPTEGFGLRGMRARVEQVDGTLVLSGERGTTLEVEVPR